MVAGTEVTWSINPSYILHLSWENAKARTAIENFCLFVTSPSGLSSTVTSGKSDFFGASEM